MVQKLIKKYIANVIGVIIIVFFVWYIISNQNMFGSLKNINWQYMILMIFIEIVLFLINSYLDQSMIHRFDSNVSFFDCYLLAYANNFLNKILPTIGGGATFRAVYLKKKYQFPYSQFVSTITGLYVISFFSTSLIGLVCLLIIYIQFNVYNLVLLITFLGLLSPCLFIIFFSPQIPDSNNRVLKIAKSVFDGWNIIKKDLRYVFIYAFFSILLLFFSALEILVSYQALGMGTNYISMLFLSTLGIIQALFNFTPDGIGVKEGLFMFSSDLVKIPNEILVMGSLVLRGASLCSTFIFGGISYFILMRRLKILEDKENISP